MLGRLPSALKTSPGEVAISGNQWQSVAISADRDDDLFRRGLRVLPEPLEHLGACTLGLRLHLNALRDLRRR